MVCMITVSVKMAEGHVIYTYVLTELFKMLLCQCHQKYFWRQKQQAIAHHFKTSLVIVLSVYRLLGLHRVLCKISVYHLANYAFEVIGTENLMNLLECEAVYLEFMICLQKRVYIVNDKSSRMNFCTTCNFNHDTV